MRKKEFLESLSITIFVIQGNHEQRPQTIERYQEKVWRGGLVYWEEGYSSLLFVKDGQVFELDGKQAIVMGRTVLTKWYGSCMGTAGGRMNSLPMRIRGMWRARWIS